MTTQFSYTKILKNGNSAGVKRSWLKRQAHHEIQRNRHLDALKNLSTDNPIQTHKDFYHHAALAEVQDRAARDSWSAHHGYAGAEERHSQCQDKIKTLGGVPS